MHLPTYQIPRRRGRPTPRPSVESAGEFEMFQGALGGGGFAFEMAMAPDGSYALLRGDTPNGYRWRRSTDAWDNISTSRCMSAIGVNQPMSFGQFKGIAISADSATCYMVNSDLGQGNNSLICQNTGGGFEHNSYGQIYRSDDRGDTWYKPGVANPLNQTLPYSYTVGYHESGHYFYGPVMAVDPNNKDVFYYVGHAGQVYASYDGGVTITLLIDLMRSALSTKRCFVTAQGLVGQNTVTVDSCPINGDVTPSDKWSAFNATRPFTFGGRHGFYDNVNAATATSFQMWNVMHRDNGAFTSISEYLSTAVSCHVGDEVFFGRGGAVCIDGSAGTVANTGGSGVRSAVVYFAWAIGATSMWKTEDGGATFSAMAGSPALLQCKMKMSNDANIAPTGGNNVLYVAAITTGAARLWRYVKTHPNGSSLADNTWTNLGGGGFVAGEYFTAATPDPLVKGKIGIVDSRGNSYYSPDYGDTITAGTSGLLPIINSGDTPWLRTETVQMADTWFDPVVSNTMWIIDGVGTYRTNFITTPGERPVWTPEMQQMESLIVMDVVKVPAGGPILIGPNQDRALIVSPNVTTVPNGYFPGTFVDNTGGHFAYSLDDPTKIFNTRNGNLIQYDFTDDGAGTQNWTAVTANGVNGWVSRFGASLISRTSTEMLVASSNENILYGTRSGSVWSWVNSTFSGSPLVIPQVFDHQAKYKMLKIDWTTGIIWLLDYNNGTLYKSTDGGATFTRPGSAGGFSSNAFLGSHGPGLSVVPGREGHLFVANGTGGGTNNSNSQLKFTNDGGVSWHNVVGTDLIVCATVCPQAPTGSYPTLYFLGRLTGESQYRTRKLYRCTDFNPTTFSGTFVDISSYLAAVNCESFEGGMAHDPEHWHTFYMCTNDTGYIVGRNR